MPKTDVPSSIPELRSSFVQVACMSHVSLNLVDVCCEYLSRQEAHSSKWRKGYQAVYAFFIGDICLKVGKAGPKSAARFTSQHSRTNAKSTLAKSLLLNGRHLIGRVPEETATEIKALTEETVGPWIETNTDRLNAFLPESAGPFALSLLESYLQCRFQPVFEGGVVSYSSRPAGEMCFSDVSEGESPDLGLWAEFLEPGEIEELRQLEAERRAEKK